MRVFSRPVEKTYDFSTELPYFNTETKRLASTEGSSDFSALCDLSFLLSFFVTDHTTELGNKDSLEAD